jgi:hypothetical protein
MRETGSNFLDKQFGSCCQNFELLKTTLKENKEMKSRFAYGMFAGFGLACLFFFFFLFFFPNVFRTLTAKKSPTYPNPVAMTQVPPYYNYEDVAYNKPDPEAPPVEPVDYSPEGYTAYSPDGDYIPAYDDAPDAPQAPYGSEAGPIAYYGPNGNAPYNGSGSPYPPAS